MRRISNPPSRFEASFPDWELEPPPASLQIFEDATRQILSENSSPDIPFRWSVNPYRGCAHACAYCYARPTHEYLGFGAGTDFETRLMIKPRAPELLRTALLRPSWQGELICFSGDTDCYQPIEAHYRLTRRCLEVCADVGNQVSIITKGFLIVRDLDLLAAMAREQLVEVAISIPFADDAMARRIEPGAPRPSKRFEAMTRLAEAGVPVDIMVGPIIPGLNDDQIPQLLTRARDSGARGASHVLLRLAEQVRQVFLERLREQEPLRADRVEARIRDVRDGQLNDSRLGHRMSGTGPYWDMIARSFEMHRRRLGLEPRTEVMQRRAARPLLRPRQPTLF